MRSIVVYLLCVAGCTSGPSGHSDGCQCLGMARRVSIYHFMSLNIVLYYLNLFYNLYL
jgi:hypothetical protein